MVLRLVRDQNTEKLIVTRWHRTAESYHCDNHFIRCLIYIPIYNNPFMFQSNLPLMWGCTLLTGALTDNIALCCKSWVRFNFFAGRPSIFFCCSPLCLQPCVANADVSLKWLRGLCFLCSANVTLNAAQEVLWLCNNVTWHPPLLLTERSHNSRCH